MLAKSNLRSEDDAKIISRGGFSVVGAVEGPITVDLVAYGENVNVFEYNLVAIGGPETDLITSGSVVVTTVNVPKILSISVTPPSLNFGTVMPGENVPGDTITVTNTGTVTVDVDAELNRSGTVFDYLRLAGYSPPPSNWPGKDGLKGGEPVSLTTELQVPRDYSAKGPETATLIFWATPSLP